MAKSVARPLLKRRLISSSSIDCSQGVPRSLPSSSMASTGTERSGRRISMWLRPALKPSFMSESSSMNST